MGEKVVKVQREKAPKTPKTPKTPKVPKTPKAPKTPKSPRSSRQSAAAGGDKKTGLMLFSIRNKIIVCFLVPILFMIIVGISAYQKAAEGMSEKFTDSTTQTMNMATEYVDMSCSFIESEGTTYAFDKDLSKYYIGLYNDDPINKMKVTDNTRMDILASQTSNIFINNIHIITKDGINMFSTGISTTQNGFFQEYEDSVPKEGKGLQRWIDSHAFLDDTLKLKPQDYILAYQILSQSGNACIVIDIKTRTIREFLESLDLGDGSIVGFVTENGREIIYENLAEGEESIFEEGEVVFFGQEFFPIPDKESDEEQYGSQEVTFKGRQYLFIYSVSKKTAATVCTLVPMDVITGQAEEIRSLTFALVVVACVVVVLVGLLIVSGIQKNMKRISKGFGVVAQGDLTVRVDAKGHDEFQNLAGSANNMIRNTKSLVNKVTGATDQLEVSAKDVEQVSGVINDYSASITKAVNEISETMTQQTSHVEECVAKTNILAEELQEVSNTVERVGRLVDETEEMIDQGVKIIRLLGDRAKQTTDITATVGQNIESLRQETEIINSFVGTITEISEQTNLLSLNASIEAARAGEAGRGFAVVAEEIRKLADDSAKAAGEISHNVSHITARTDQSVESAHEAGTMVASQTEAVEQVVTVFNNMQLRMKQLVEGLNAIVESTERADEEKSDTVAAIDQISTSIEETADSVITVRDSVEKLMENVEGLTETADSLGKNMQELKTEISVFKI
ncbi:MAG: methyl-accepting chemotaxis protein [Eubacterium sp.]|nr:methyl-accepting chemotaxis protein [Eubacterium sp.]MCM1217107.1 methyl-accepting chemotaxis protein [Lachnospiraceae bacterium]MCM1240371.1 methyl-accepting chemotaxis protein [Lachnospiraceae bacterium]